MSIIDRRLRLRCRSGQEGTVYGDPSIASNPMKILNETKGVIFPYTPTITYKQNPQWANQDLTHSIQQYYYFTAIESATITIAGTFTVQNQKEGEYLLAVWHFFRSYAKMEFGVRAGEKKGLPPPILILDGYGQYVFNQLPVLIQTWNMDFPSDVDYAKVLVNGGDYAYLPTKTSIQINLVVQRPPNKLKTDFNLQDFRNGKSLAGFT